MEHFTIYAGSIEDAVNQLSKARLGNKNNWISTEIYISNSLRLKTKSFNTYNQLLIAPSGMKLNTTMGNKVSQWKQEVVDALEYTKNLQ